MNSFVSIHKDTRAARSKLLEQLGREIRDRRVIQAMERVPRELFVPRACRHLAYGDIPLLIEEGQTISQPFIVALMTEALELKGDEKVLEVGTGSGYQAAILAELARWVVSVERHTKLAQSARELLNQLGYQNVEIHVTEKSLGWSSGAPYDAIVVTAGAPQVPPELLEQLVVSGRMVIPVGSRYNQDLLKIVKRETEVTTINLGPCRFVPLIGAGAWQEESYF